MKKIKICYITTVHGTLRSFVLPTADYIAKHTDWEIYMICNNDEEFKNTLLDRFNFIPINMKRGMSISGISAILKMLKIFKKRKI